jgi:hypothetical protein
MIARLLIVPIPDGEAMALSVPSKSSLVIRMDIHHRPNCVLAPGIPLGLASVCERLQLEQGTEISVSQYVAEENNYYTYKTKIEVDRRG